eukprot:348814_1
MTCMITLLFLYQIIPYFCHSYQINCNADSTCIGSTIQCHANENCIISCGGDYSCKNSNINCPDSYTCTVRCAGDYSCKKANIYAHKSSMDVICGGDYSCGNAIIDGRSSLWFNVECIGYSSCGNTIQYYPTTTTILPTKLPTLPTQLPTKSPTTTTVFNLSKTTTSVEFMESTSFFTTNNHSQTDIKVSESKQTTKLLAVSNRAPFVVATIIILIFLFIIATGLYHSNYNDYQFCFANVFWFGCSLLDSATDILFILILYNTEYILLFWISILFILASICFSLFQLNKNIKKWMLLSSFDIEWFKQYSSFLYVICFICASCYHSISLCHSNLFGLKRFNLFINDNCILNLHQQHLLSNILIESIPQFIIQLIFTIQSHTIHDITILSAIFSIGSIIRAPFMWNTRKQIIKKKNIKKNIIDYPYILKKKKIEETDKIKRDKVHHQI